MKKYDYKILRKNILNVELVSTSSQNWYNSNHELINWSGSFYIGPNQNDVVYNVAGSLDVGYYKWTGTTWNEISGSNAYDNHNLPIFLTSTVDEMGVMVGFDGDIQQVEELVNFSYLGNTNTNQITVFSTTNPSVLRKITEQEFTLDWGDGDPSETLSVNKGVEGENLPSLSHTYGSNGEYEITLSLLSPWTSQKLKKKVTVPFSGFTSITGDMGTYTTIILTGHGYNNITGQSINYLTNVKNTRHIV